MKRLTHNQFVEEIGTLKKISENKIEFQCGICRESIICEGTNWKIVKKAYLQRVLHHKWVHDKEKISEKNNSEKQFEFSSSFEDYSDKYQRDLLWELRQEENESKMSFWGAFIGWLKKIYNIA